jgi:hypothetical protein
VLLPVLLHHSGVVLLLYFFVSVCIYLFAMPRAKGKSISRELQCLAVASRRGGCVTGDTSEWTFDFMGHGNKGSIVTPAVGSASSPNDDDPLLTVDVDDQDTTDVEDSRFSSCNLSLLMDYYDDTSASSDALDDISMLKCNKRNNIISDLDSLMSHINNIATCRHCEATSMNSFIDYCDDRMQEVYMFAECRFHIGKTWFEYTKNAVNLKQWYTD